MQTNLFFALNNDKQLDRQIRLLLYMSILNTSVSINDLTRYIECSAPTLRQDIVALNLELPEGIHVESKDKDGYILIHPEGISMSTIAMQLAKESDSYRIIDSIFHNEIYSFDDLLSELFTSPSTLRKTIAHINSVLKSFEISITTNYITMIGDESNIRFFLFSFYSDFSDFFAVDTEYEKNERAYIELLNDASNRIIPSLHLSNFRTTLWLMIVKERIKNRCFVTLDSKLSTKMSSSPEFKEFEKTFNRICEDFFYIFNPPLSEVVWGFVILLHCVSFSNPSQSLFSNYRREYTFHYDTSPDLMERVNKFLALQFDSETIQSDYIVPMQSYLINLATLSRLSHQFQRVTLSFRAFTQESINSYFILWMNHLSTPEANALFDIQFKEDIAISLSMLHFSVLSNQREFDLKVIFAFHGEPGFDDFLVRTAQFMIPQSVNPTFIFDNPITQEIVEIISSDLVVTNYDLPFASQLPCQVVRLSYIPSMTEWTTLRNIMLNLSTFGQSNLYNNSTHRIEE